MSVHPVRAATELPGRVQVTFPPVPNLEEVLPLPPALQWYLIHKKQRPP